MYLAQEWIKQQTHYYIRETFQEGSQSKSRILFDLGTDPAQYIIYPGGKGYYFDEVVEASRLFETTWENLRQMDSNTFTRLYRKQALKFHPDQGGSHKTFVKLTKLYENLMKKKGHKPS